MAADKPFDSASFSGEHNLGTCMCISARWNSQNGELRDLESKQEKLLT